MNKLIFLGFLAASVLTLSACETVDGMGRDLQSAGRSISDAAD